VQTFSSAVQLVLLPKIAQVEDPAEQKRGIERVFSTFWTVSLAITPLLAAGLPVLIVVLFGKAFSGAIVPAEILLISFLFTGPRDVLITASQAVGKPLLGSAVQWLGAIMLAALMYLLMPRFGIIGAAAAMATASAAQLAATLQGLHKHSLFDFRTILHVDFRRIPSLIRQLIPPLRVIPVAGGKQFGAAAQQH
jgi:O-antigen/teichoic acid export membrane protein